MMVPATGGELHTQDSVQIEWVKPDAAMINASHFVTESGEVSTNIGLKWNEDTGRSRASCREKKSP